MEHGLAYASAPIRGLQTTLALLVRQPRLEEKRNDLEVQMKALEEEAQRAKVTAEAVISPEILQAIEESALLSSRSSFVTNAIMPPLQSALAVRR